MTVSYLKRSQFVPVLSQNPEVVKSMLLKELSQCPRCPSNLRVSIYKEGPPAGIRFTRARFQWDIWDSGTKRKGSIGCRVSVVMN